MVSLNPQKFTMMTSFRNWISNGSIDDVGRLMRADADDRGNMVLAVADDVECMNVTGLFTKKDRPMYVITMKRVRWADEEVLHEAYLKANAVLKDHMKMDDEDREVLRDSLEEFFYDLWCYEVTIDVKAITDGGINVDLGTMKRKVYDAHNFGLEGMILDAFCKYNDV